MFKPTHFRFQNSIQWPGAGPTTEVFADNCAKVEDAGEHFTFVHAGGHAVKVPKAEVTTYGVYDADDVPNLPTEDDYKDGIDKKGDADADADEGVQEADSDNTGSADEDNADDNADEDNLVSDTAIDSMFSVNPSKKSKKKK